MKKKPLASAEKLLLLSQHVQTQAAAAEEAGSELQAMEAWCWDVQIQQRWRANMQKHAKIWNKDIRDIALFGRYDKVTSAKAIWNHTRVEHHLEYLRSASTASFLSILTKIKAATPFFFAFASVKITSLNCLNDLNIRS